MDVRVAGSGRPQVQLIVKQKCPAANVQTISLKYYLSHLHYTTRRTNDHRGLEDTRTPAFIDTRRIVTWPSSREDAKARQTSEGAVGPLPLSPLPTPHPAFVHRDGIAERLDARPGPLTCRSSRGRRRSSDYHAIVGGT